jgi:D-arabinose 1-dehydrogenase-like Zn-dependent alcohol dehydrogenase
MAFTPPESYIAYAFTKKGGDLERVDVPWRDPQAGELVARVLACGVCARYIHARSHDIVPALTPRPQ